MINNLNQDDQNLADESLPDDELEELDDDLEEDELDDITAELEELDPDLPQTITESYGTGVHDQPGFSVGGRTLADRLEDFNEASPVLTGGDIDANWEQANAVGDESVGGTVATPDQDIVDELGAAVGLEMDDKAFLRTTEILEERDDRRWDLDPESSEDYGDRRE